MIEAIDWYQSLTETSEIALESIYGENDLSLGPVNPNPAPWFNPVNISIENGIYYATVYVCQLVNTDPRSTQLAIWLQTLKETDVVKLSVCSLFTNIRLDSLLSVLSALVNSRAQIHLLLDQIVVDELAYFYLTAEHVEVLDHGEIFIPSYVSQRKEDTSAPWKAIYDFFVWVVDRAVERDVLTPEEAESLHGGQHVVIPTTRFMR